MRGTGLGGSAGDQANPGGKAVGSGDEGAPTLCRRCSGSGS